MNVRQCRAMLAFVAEPVNTPPAMQKTQEMLAGSLGWEDSLEEENGNPLQYSCLKNAMDRGVWWATVHGVTELNTTQQLNNNG